MNTFLLYRTMTRLQLPEARRMCVSHRLLLPQMRAYGTPMHPKTIKSRIVVTTVRDFIVMQIFSSVWTAVESSM